MSLTTAKTIVITTLSNKPIISTARIPSLHIMEDDYQVDGQQRKRRRLTNLTQEEKFMRRKLKNRVAAQTARDRKKALMVDLEEKIAELEAENQKLSLENATLKSQSGALVQENSELRGRLSLLDEVPVKSDALASFLKQISDCKSEEQQDQQCPRILTLEEETGHTQQYPPQGAVVGPTPAELESLNELIKFDHVYYKTHAQHNSGQNSHNSLGQNAASVRSAPSNMKFTIIKGNKSHSIQVYVTGDEKKKDSVTTVTNQSAVSLLKNKSVLASTNTVIMDQFKPVRFKSQATESDISVEDMNVINPLSLDMDSIEVGELNMDLLEDLENILKEECESIAHNSAPVPSPQIQRSEKPMDSSKHGTQNSVTKGVKRKHNKSDSMTVPCLSVEEMVTNVLSPGEVDHLSDSGISCDLNDVVSPYSQYSDLNEFPSSPLQDSPWEESFQELFPDLV